ncbi:MAG: tRNA-dihydrouridine synthase [Candidatus Eiseniibacteriota bacterium]
MSRDLSVSVGAVALKNPVICGSAEHLIEAAGIDSALDAGAAAVVIKSVNESEAARHQLDLTDYALLDSQWRRLPWDFAPPRDSHLLCRSGLTPVPFDQWLDRVVVLDRAARARDAYVVASVIPADFETAVAMVRKIDQAGARIIEVNIGAPHAGEAKAGAITLERAAARVADMTRQVRAATTRPLWIKLTGQSEDVAALVAAARDGGADAVTVMGRFMAFLPDVETLAPMLGTAAAFGGPWALPLTCRWLALSRRLVGPGFPLLATNGARDGLDVARFLLAGASAVQMTSAVFTGGFGVVRDTLAELTRYLDDKGRDARELIGVAADRLQTYAAQESRPGYWRRFVPPGSLDDKK